MLNQLTEKKREFIKEATANNGGNSRTTIGTLGQYHTNSLPVNSDYGGPTMMMVNSSDSMSLETYNHRMRNQQSGAPAAPQRPPNNN